MYSFRFDCTSLRLIGTRPGACPHHGFSELHQLNTFYNALNTTDQDSLNSAVGGNFLDKMPRKCLKIIESKSRVRQSQSKAVVAKVSSSSSTPAVSSDVAELKDMTQGQTMKNQLTNLTDMLSKFVNANTASSSGSTTLPSNTVTNPKEDLKGITTRSGAAYQGLTIPSSSSTPPKVVNRETKVTKDTMLPTNNGGTEVIHPPVVQMSEPIVAPVSAPMPNQKTSILFSIRRNDERRREKANDQIEKFYEIFRDLSFKIFFTDSLTLMPKFASTLKTLIRNKEKLSEMAKTPINENCSAVILNKLPKKLRDPDRFLIPYDPTSPKVDDSYYDSKGDILLLEEVLNSDPSPPPPNQRNYLPEIQKELKICEAKTVKSSSDEPPEFELKDLPPHLEYAFLEGDNKLPVIIAKDLKDEEKAALIKGVKLEFCTHKILMEEDYEPTVQHQRRVNPKIHDVIKKEVEKLLDARLIYPISNSPWVSLVHCVPKKGGITVVKNDDNDLIPTRLVTGWRYLFAKKDAKARLMWWILLLEEFDIDVRDKKGAENLAADHLSRLKNPHQDEYENKEITKTFLLGTLGSIALRSDSTPWFADFVNYHAGNFIVKGIDGASHQRRPSSLFLKSLFARFGAPLAIISDRGTNFCNDQFSKVMLKYGVTYHLSTVYHPQTSGQVEVSIHGLKRILKRTVGENRASWSDKLDDALWAFCTAYKTPIRKVQLNELNELRDHAYENYLIYKDKTKRIHDAKIKNRVFNVGDQVLLFNSKSKIFFGKLKSRWSGPFTIVQVFPYGTIELSQSSGPNFKVNGHRLKHYFRGDIPTEDCPDCEVSQFLSVVLHSQELHILSFILGIPIS
nr:reverse transcriptase domain-containing protein [Tanacetum cinerariifolium]